MLIGIKISSKPADEEHPYGHERFEMIGGLIVSIILMYAGIDVLTSAIDQLRNPTLESIHIAMWIVTIISLVVKFSMMVMYRKSAKQNGSELLEAGEVDSRNDVIIAIALLIGFFVQTQYNIVIDGYLGLIISLLILLGAFGLMRDAVTVLMGKRPSQKDIDAVVKILKEHEDIAGYHDLLIHTYGKLHKFGSVHIELDGSMTLNKAHEIADKIEREIDEMCSFEIVIHLDPIDYYDAKSNHVRLRISKTLKNIPEIESYHDFRVIDGIVEFDVVLKEDCEASNEAIEKEIREALSFVEQPIEVNVDRNYLLRNHK